MKPLRSSFVLLSLLPCLPTSSALAAPDTLPEVQELVVPGAAPGEFVAWSVAVDGSTIVLGSITAPGTAYVFVRDAGTWTLQATLVPQGATHAYGFGGNAALEGDTLVMGAGGEDLGGGAIYVFERTGDVWDDGLRIPNPGGGGFGASVAIEDGRIAAGAIYAHDANGAVFVLERDGSGWVVADELTASDPLGADYLGSAVALQGDTLLAGAVRAGHSGEGAGRAYVFEQIGASWVQTQVLAPDDLQPHVRFGHSVALDGGLLAVGAPASDFPPVGAAYVYTSVTGAWTLEKKLSSPTGSTSDRFASALALRAGQLLVGAQLAHGAEGAAHVYERAAGTWPRGFDLAPVGLDPAGHFGQSVAMRGADLVVGAPYGTPAGSAFVFELEPPPTFNYCVAQPNSTGWPCVLGAQGSVSVAADDLVLLAGHCPAGSPGLFLCGQGQAQIPMASGTLCVSPFHPGLFRLGTTAAPGLRDLVTFALDLEHLPAGCSIVAGSTWYFQFWYRDSGPGGYDLSDGLGATFVP